MSSYRSESGSIFLAASSLLALLSMLSACGRTERSANLVPIRLALVNVPLAYLPAILADNLGYYRQEGLAVTLDEFSSATKATQALLGKSADIAAGSYEQNLQVAAGGKQIKAFVALLRQPSRVLLVTNPPNSGIRRIVDLKGKAVGVAGIGSVNQFFLDYILIKNQIAPADVKVVAIGTASSAVAAVEHGTVDAAVLGGSEPFIVLQRYPRATLLVDSRGPEGCRRLYDSDSYPTAVVNATGDWLQHHRTQARHFARAVQRALLWIQAHSANEIRLQLPDRFKTDEEAAEIQALTAIKPSFSRDGVMPQEGAEAVRKALAATVIGIRDANVNISQTYTNEFLSTGLQ